MSLTPIEFAKLRDETRWTELQRDAFWRDKIGGQSIRWRGFVSGIEETEYGIHVAVNVDTGTSEHNVMVGFMAPRTQVEHYLKFPLGSEVEVTGTFFEGPGFGNTLKDGRIEHR